MVIWIYLLIGRILLVVVHVYAPPTYTRENCIPLTSQFYLQCDDMVL
jgi:hypothetical protein